MRVARWQTFAPVANPLQEFQGEVNRLFDQWLGEKGTPAYPPVNIWEEKDHLYVEAELPGLDPATLEVLVAEGNQLTIKGERKKPAPEKGFWHRQERGSGRFARTVTLPYLVDAEHVEAKLEHGVLRVQLAKHESAKPRKIAVKAQ